MASFTALVTSHNFERGLRHILGNLMYQSRPPDETIVLYSDYPGAVIHKLIESFPWVARWVRRDNHGDYGHDKRAFGIDSANSDYLGFFNDDDRYDRRYIEKMMGAADEGVPVVYCNWSGGDGQNAEFRGCSSTSGNFIISTHLARKVGWAGRDYPADAEFINRVAERAKATKVEETLYFWNGLTRD